MPANSIQHDYAAVRVYQGQQTGSLLSSVCTLLLCQYHYQETAGSELWLVSARKLHPQQASNNCKQDMHRYPRKAGSNTSNLLAA
jgi:hypothetical protein